MDQPIGRKMYYFRKSLGEIANFVIDLVNILPRKIFLHHIPAGEY